MKMSRLEAGVRIALRYYEAYNRHNPAEMAGLLDEMCVFETAVPAPDLNA